MLFGVYALGVRHMKLAFRESLAEVIAGALREFAEGETYGRTREQAVADAVLKFFYGDAWGDLA